MSKRDRRRNQSAAGAFAKMVLSDKNPHAAANRETVAGWFASWQPKALAAAEAMASAWALIPKPTQSFEQALDQAKDAQRALLAEHGLVEFTS